MASVNVLERARGFAEKRSYREVHGLLGSALCIPLLVTAASGALWTVQVHWMGRHKDDAVDPVFGIKLMTWHQGGVLFPFISKSTYMWLVLLTVPVLLVAGGTMLKQASVTCPLALVPQSLLPPRPQQCHPIQLRQCRFVA